MGFDSQANQGTGSSASGEGSDQPPGGYQTPPGAGPPSAPVWPAPPPPPAGPAGPAGPGTPPGYGPPTYAPTYGAPSYPPPPPPPPNYGGYSPPPGGYGTPTGGYGAPTGGYGAPTGPGAGGFASYPTGYYPGAAAPRTDGTAVAALVLAIAAFVVCPLIPAVVALALIPGSRRTIQASGGAVGGLGLLTAAKIIAWINIGLGVLGLGAFIIAVIASSATSTSNAVALLIRPLFG